MIENFEKVKEQLRDLAEIVNSFTSEAVQLRIVELVFGGITIQKNTTLEPEPEESSSIPPATRKKARKRTPAKNGPSEAGRKKPVSAGSGPIATLVKLAEGDFFNTPQSMKSIIDHCEVNLARKIKQSDISGKLARMVREQVLKRAKNVDGQYEYSKA